MSGEEKPAGPDLEQGIAWEDLREGTPLVGQAGGEAVREAPQRPATSTLVAPAHHALERTGGARPGVPQPGGRQQAWRTGLVPLYTLGPSQRRAQHAGPGGVEVEGGTVPTRDWLLNLQILTSGGFR